MHKISIPSIRADVANTDIVHTGKPTVEVRTKGQRRWVQGPSHALKLTPQSWGFLRYEIRGQSVPRKPGVHTFSGNFGKCTGSEELAYDFCRE